MMRLVFLIFVLSLLADNSFAADRTWSGAITKDFYDCASDGADTLIISGAVNLSHPSDADLGQPPKKIRIVCGNLQFQSNSSLTTISALDIRIGHEIRGPIKIFGARGIKGKDSALTPDIWKVRKMPSAGQGSSGGGGRNASGCAGINDHSSDEGGPGGRGGDGVSGLTFQTPKGAPGESGVTGADIVLITRSAAVGTTVEINSKGGDGGSGGRGGRGADGGDGGKGGDGGAGGGANRCHLSSRGGNGGPGGDGGDGGNGGAGGDGGNGGNGGTVTALLGEGSAHQPSLVIENQGGRGGLPGIGGEHGEGGAGGPGGNGGRGGDGSPGVGGGLDRKDPSRTGNGGSAGQPGRPGQPGPLGLRGKDGFQGRIGRGFSGSVPKEVIDGLLNAGQ